MVSPQKNWGMLESPSTYSQEKKRLFTSEDKDSLNEHEKSEEIEQEPDKKNWSSLEDSSTYQGEVQPEDDESTFGWLARNAVTSTMRIGESAVGKWGDIYDTMQNAVANLPAASGLVGYAIHSMMGEQAWKNMILEKPGIPGFIEAPSGPKPPTSNQLKKITEAFTGDYTKPKTENEKKFQDFVSDIGAIARGRNPNESLAQYAANNLGIPFAANTVKELSKELGLDEEGSSSAKGISWIAMSLLNNVNAPRYLSRLQRESRNQMPMQNPINVPSYQNRINASARNFLPGDEAAAPALNQYNSINQQIQNGQTTLGDLITRYDAINRAKNSKGMFDLNAGERTLARINMDRLLHDTRDEIQSMIGHTPAYNLWRQATQGQAVIHQSNRMMQWASNLLTGKYSILANSSVAGLFGVSLKTLPPFLSVGLAGAGTGAYKAGQVAYRVYQDPILSGYYWNAISAQARQDAPAFINNIRKLEENYNKIEKKDKKKSVR